MFLNQEVLLPDERNRLKTKNNMGFVHLTPLNITQKLYRQAETQKGFYVDIGAAYGVDTLHMIKAGARVLAIDLESQHLDILKNQLSPKEQQRLETRCQRFPEEVSLAPETYDAILLSRILIFLTPTSLDAALKKIFNVLKIGGKVYIITISPFSVNWGSVQDVFKEHLKLYPAQPLYITNLWELLPQTRMFLPQCIQVFDQSALKNSLEKNGFKVIECDYESHYGTVDTCAIAQKLI